MYQRGSVAGRKPARPAVAEKRMGLTFFMWLQWMVATTGGAALGHAVGYMVARLILPDATGGTFFAIVVGIVAGAAMGAVLGAAQGAVLAQRIGLDGWREWALASAIGGAVRWAVISPIMSLLLTVRTGWGGTADVTDLCIFFIALALFGVLSGIAFGIPQARVLRKRLGEVSDLDTAAWAAANAAASLITVPIVSLSGLNSSAAAAMLGVAGVMDWRVIAAVAIAWVAVAFMTSFPLNDRLRGHPL